jgi:hypothetical protein
LQLFALLALVWIGRPCAAGQQDKVLRVFLFMGQSNMVGADSRVEDIRLYPPFAGLEQPQKAVKFAYCIGRENKAQSDGWTELQPVEGMVGPELSFARRVTQHIDAPIACLHSGHTGDTAASIEIPLNVAALAGERRDVAMEGGCTAGEEAQMGSGPAEVCD